MNIASCHQTNFFPYIFNLKFCSNWLLWSLFETFLSTCTLFCKFSFHIWATSYKGCMAWLNRPVRVEVLSLFIIRSSFSLFYGSWQIIFAFRIHFICMDASIRNSLCLSQKYFVIAYCHLFFLPWMIPLLNTITAPRNEVIAGCERKTVALPHNFKSVLRALLILPFRKSSTSR